MISRFTSHVATFLVVAFAGFMGGVLVAMATRGWP